MLLVVRPGAPSSVLPTWKIMEECEKDNAIAITFHSFRTLPKLVGIASSLEAIAITFLFRFAISKALTIRSTKTLS